MKQRLYYLDRLRVFLTVLVIVHHAAITYGAGGSWYFEDVDKTEITVSIVILTLFTAINQSFFMGLFFFLSGYFTPSSYDRKGPAVFLQDRFIRLGIPLLAFHFLFGPYTSFIGGSGEGRSFAQFYQEEVLSFRAAHFGPLWFVEALLYFALGYAAWRAWTGLRSTPSDKANRRMHFPPQRIILLTAAGLGLVAFVVRLVYPTGTAVLGLQLGYFPSYILLFAAGIAAQRGDWLSSLPEGMVRTWTRISIAVIPVLPIALIATGGLEGNLIFAGGMNLQAFVYAMWEPFVGIGIMLYLLKRFS